MLLVFLAMIGEGLGQLGIGAVLCELGQRLQQLLLGEIDIRRVKRSSDRLMFAPGVETQGPNRKPRIVHPVPAFLAEPQLARAAEDQQSPVMKLEQDGAAMKT